MDLQNESLQAMQVMIEAQNWQGYLHFRRMYYNQGGRQSAITKMIKSLSDESQLLYGRYFQSRKEVSNRVKTLLEQEDSARKAERQAKFEEGSKIHEAKRQAKLEERNKIQEAERQAKFEEGSKIQKTQPVRKVKTKNAQAQAV